MVGLYWLMKGLVGTGCQMLHLVGLVALVVGLVWYHHTAGWLWLYHKYYHNR